MYFKFIFNLFPIFEIRCFLAKICRKGDPTVEIVRRRKSQISISLHRTTDIYELQEDPLCMICLKTSKVT